MLTDTDTGKNKRIKKLKLVFGRSWDSWRSLKQAEEHQKKSVFHISRTNVPSHSPLTHPSAETNLPPLCLGLWTLEFQVAEHPTCLISLFSSLQDLRSLFFIHLIFNCIIPTSRHLSPKGSFRDPNKDLQPAPVGHGYTGAHGRGSFQPRRGQALQDPCAYHNTAWCW